MTNLLVVIIALRIASGLLIGPEGQIRGRYLVSEEDGFSVATETKEFNIQVDFKEIKELVNLLKRPDLADTVQENYDKVNSEFQAQATGQVYILRPKSGKLIVIRRKETALKATQQCHKLGGSLFNINNRAAYETLVQLAEDQLQAEITNLGASTETYDDFWQNIELSQEYLPYFTTTGETLPLMLTSAPSTVDLKNLEKGRGKMCAYYSRTDNSFKTAECNSETARKYSLCQSDIDLDDLVSISATLSTRKEQVLNLEANLISLTSLFKELPETKEDTHEDKEIVSLFSNDQVKFIKTLQTTQHESISDANLKVYVEYTAIILHRLQSFRRSIFERDPTHVINLLRPAVKQEDTPTSLDQIRSGGIMNAMFYRQQDALIMKITASQGSNFINSSHLLPLIIDGYSAEFEGSVLLQDDRCILNSCVSNPCSIFSTQVVPCCMKYLYGQEEVCNLVPATPTRYIGSLQENTYIVISSAITEVKSSSCPLIQGFITGSVIVTFKEKAPWCDLTVGGTLLPKIGEVAFEKIISESERKPFTIQQPKPSQSTPQINEYLTTGTVVAGALAAIISTIITGFLCMKQNNQRLNNASAAPETETTTHQPLQPTIKAIRFQNIPTSLGSLVSSEESSDE